VIGHAVSRGEFSPKNHRKIRAFCAFFVVLYEGGLCKEKYPSKIQEKAQFSLTFFDLTVKLSLIVFAPRAWEILCDSPGTRSSGSDWLGPGFSGRNGRPPLLAAAGCHPFH
jgi:hypothetical protein